MENKRKQKLIKLGADKLADALVELSVHSESADDLIEQMIASPEENVQRFQMKLNRKNDYGIRRCHMFNLDYIKKISAITFGHMEVRVGFGKYLG